jgi:hypothetical protein
VPSRSRRTTRHGLRRKHNPCKVRYRYEPRQEVFVFCWILLTYPVMVYHISGLQPVSSLDRECASTLVSFSPRYAETNAVVLRPICRGMTHHRLLPDDCVWFTSGCVSMYRCVCVLFVYRSVCDGNT